MAQIIDVHTHLITPGPVPAEDELIRAARLAKHYGIDRLVLLGNITATGGPEPVPSDIKAINDHTLAAMGSSPDLFIGFCYLNPANPFTFNADEIERCVIEGGMKGIKLWQAVKASDSRLDPIMARAEELGIPVLHHAWYVVTGSRPNASTPVDIAHLANRFPAVTIIMAHLGGCRELGVRDIRDCKNVYIDTSGSQPEVGHVEYAVQHLGVERVLYGSDWPLRDFSAQLGRVVGARISDHEKEAVFGGNAARVLRLEVQ